MGKYKLLVLDVDGTLTDGKVYLTETGDEMKAFNIKDGYGIKHLLPRLGMQAAIITGRKSEIVARRAKELDIALVYQGITDKQECLRQLLENCHISWNEVVYIGDDVNDISCMKKSAFACCPKDAHVKVKEICDWQGTYNGGEGVVRELIDYLEELGE